jgi:hypothetical protein
MSSYRGTVDEDAVSELIVAFGRIVESAGEVGFVLTYHAVDAADTAGVMDLVGQGIGQTQLEYLLRRALDHNARTGATT